MPLKLVLDFWLFKIYLMFKKKDRLIQTLKSKVFFLKYLKVYNFTKNRTKLCSYLCILKVVFFHVLVCSNVSLIKILS